MSKTTNQMPMYIATYCFQPLLI